MNQWNFELEKDNTTIDELVMFIKYTQAGLLHITTTTKPVGMTGSKRNFEVAF